MNFKALAYFLFILSSCSVPIRTTQIGELNDYDEKNHLDLKIFSPEEYIEYNYKVIAEIIIENNFITGDLMYDKRAKRYLLENMNSVGADALVINNECSNSIQTCFYAIHYTEQNYE